MKLFALCFLPSFLILSSNGYATTPPIMVNESCTCTETLALNWWTWTTHSVPVSTTPPQKAQLFSSQCHWPTYSSCWHSICFCFASVPNNQDGDSYCASWQYFIRWTKGKCLKLNEERKIMWCLSKTYLWFWVSQMLNNLASCCVDTKDGSFLLVEAYVIRCIQFIQFKKI